MYKKINKDKELVKQVSKRIQERIESILWIGVQDGLVSKEIHQQIIIPILTCCNLNMDLVDAKMKENK